jgi:hypothetical protein
MGMLAVQIFLLDFPFKRRYRFAKSRWDFRGVSHMNFSSVIDNTKVLHTSLIANSTVPLTPQKSTQWCHWHRWNLTKKFYSWHHYEIFYLIIKVISAVSLTAPQSFQWVIDTADIISAVLLVPLNRCTFQLTRRKWFSMKMSQQENDRKQAEFFFKCGRIFMKLAEFYHKFGRKALLWSGNSVHYFSTCLKYIKAKKTIDKEHLKE